MKYQIDSYKMTHTMPHDAPDKESLDAYQDHIGKQVYKPSGKPFKSRNKINTVTGLMNHPVTGRACYTFEEDDSHVEIIKCKVKPT